MEPNRTKRNGTGREQIKRTISNWLPLSNRAIYWSQQSFCLYFVFRVTNDGTPHWSLGKQATIMAVEWRDTCRNTLSQIVSRPLVVAVRRSIVFTWACVFSMSMVIDTTGSKCACEHTGGWVSDFLGNPFRWKLCSKSDHFPVECAPRQVVWSI